MIFGRKKRSEDLDDDIEQMTDVEAEQEDDELPLGDSERWDAEFTRAEGPFDISEVDLEADADEVRRLDMGPLILTPFQDMTLQLQVNRETNQVQSLLVGDGRSALEVAVFAGPAKSSMTGEIRDEVIESTRQQGGRCQAVKGPFGTELRRALPVKDQNGNPAMHLSRTWLVPGPGWVLRGVLLGKATFEPDDEEIALHLFEFFSNLVVRRGNTPAAPGSLLPMRVPEAKG
ncbi:DUF3710 domain-containing protein [Tessaracoccus sp. MC1627]|uniref:DUF3710 domain-containing protein n=1 Tax=Tessaracoccus sp. MC1627 TaxID=2760312 RepID=UPI00351C3179